MMLMLSEGHASVAPTCYVWNAVEQRFRRECVASQFSSSGEYSCIEELPNDGWRC
jgi:hypothetical protein